MNNNFNGRGNYPFNFINDCPAGPRGPRGFMGMTGPTGPTGPAGSPIPYNAFAMLHHSTDLSVQPGQAIIFDTVDSAIGVEYNTVTGSFTLPAQGQYLINWWINAENSSDSPQSIVIDLVQTAPTVSLVSRSISGSNIMSSLNAVILGTAVIDAPSSASVYEFQNSSAGNIGLLAESGYSAVVTIVRIN